MTSNHCGQARNADPDTSKAAAKVPRSSLRKRMTEFFACSKDSLGPDAGWTGHELVSPMSAPLNSVTPRLAELRRASVIKDSGRRVNGQIVWVPA